MKLVLASSSKYRKTLLKQIISSFESIAPEIDETPGTNDQSPEELAERLAIAKARAIVSKTGNALVIGSDQVAWSQGAQLNKPGNRENNITQLSRCSGQIATFYTGLCLLNTETGRQQSSIETCEVKFRKLSDEQIARYVDVEKAFDCAGGFKVEGMGISLFEYIRCDDHNTLVGLPLIRLIQMLDNQGIKIP